MHDILKPEEESAILDKVLAGHREAFAGLVDAYKAPIFNLAFRMTGNLEDASDLAQETFVRAFVNIKKYNRNKRFFTWLYTIGLNIIRNHFRQKAHSCRVEIQIIAEPAASDPAGNPEAGLLEDEASRKLTSALKCLTQNQREAVVLRFYQDLSFHEMADLMGSSVSAVKMLTYRALERLRVALADENIKM